jgi:hypothetical protein
MAVDNLSAKRRRWRDLRRDWVPVIRSIVSSSVSIVGDWSFFSAVRKNGKTPELEPWFLIFCITSSVLLGALGLILLLSLPVCVRIHGVQKADFQKMKNKLTIAEMFTTNIPQFVLILIVRKRWAGDAGLNGFLIFSLSTTGINIIFNSLDLIIPLDEEYYKKKEEQAEKETRSRSIRNPQIDDDYEGGTGRSKKAVQTKYTAKMQQDFMKL